MRVGASPREMAFRDDIVLCAGLESEESEAGLRTARTLESMMALTLTFSSSISRTWIATRLMAVVHMFHKITLSLLLKYFI